jgi:hypothetical protein
MHFLSTYVHVCHRNWWGFVRKALLMKKTTYIISAAGKSIVHGHYLVFSLYSEGVQHFTVCP